METIVVTFEDGSKREYCKGVLLRDIIHDVRNTSRFDVICAEYRGQFVFPNDSLVKSGNLTFFDINTTQGNKVYERGLIFLFEVAVYEVFGKDTRIQVKHSIDKGIYCEIDKCLTEDSVNQIRDVMRDFVSKEIPFVRLDTSRDEAINYFEGMKRYDKVKTLTYTTSKFVTLYKFQGFYNYIFGDMPSDSSILKYFDFTLLNEHGVVLRFPSIYDNGKIVKYVHHEKFFSTIAEYSEWGSLFKINNLGDLNQMVVENRAAEIIQLSETLQDYKLLSIASEIVEDSSNIKMVLLSGPSSSGKTTTAKKLSLYLKTLGLNPYHLSIDDYFLERDETPLDENGKPDFESVRAVDTKLFNSQLSKLLKGNKVTLPTFNFITGKKEYHRSIQMHDNDILIIEGLHALNDELTKAVDRKNKFKIYISPLTYLNIDDDSRIGMTDIRLLRRMVRDNRTRGYSPSHTLSRWRDVRSGEEKYVFPYQDVDNVIFNSFLIYELGVIKTYAEPLLFSVSPDDPEYHTALRLLEILKFVLPIANDDIPATSILREFIGGSYFER